MASRMKIRGKIHYFVLYKGYKVDDGEWLAREDLILPLFCPALVDEYESKHGPYQFDSPALKARR